MVGHGSAENASFDRGRLPARRVRPLDAPHAPVLQHDYRDQVEEAPPVEHVRAPDRAPNVVVVMIDDMGFGASSVYGGPVAMPTAERLAGQGLTYSRFHVNALCSPTRQSLVTGRNHHAVGMAVTAEMATNFPGYSGVRPDSAGTLAQILNGNGYSTAAFGKYYQTPQHEVSPVGPFSRWPTHEGFERFYGFLSCQMNHWYPQLFEGTTPLEPRTAGEDDGYHLTEDLVDRSVDYVRTQHSLAPDKPFFLYLSPGATHAPFHVAPGWRDRYRGAFDDGYDEQRRRTLERQIEKGLVPEGTDLSPWPADVPRWDELTRDQRAVSARFMETYAGFAEHADTHVGRLVDELVATGEMENTVFVYMLGDNGASGEGGIDGAVAEHTVGHGFQESTQDQLAALDRLGDPTTYPIYPAGWALAMNTPYQWTKAVASHLGATRDGMILRWDGGIADRGGVRHQWHHVIDLLPTLLDVAGVPAPQSIDGFDQSPLHGVSMRYTFDDPAAAERRTTQHFEMAGNRAIYHEGWTAVAQHGHPWVDVGVKGVRFADDTWELYDTTTDWSQAHDVAAEHPQLLAELQRLFLIEASRYGVFPLDDRTAERHNPLISHRAGLIGPRRSVTYRGRVRALSEEAVLNTKNCSHRITARLETPPGTAPGGVVVAQGGRFGGWSLYVADGRVAYAYNLHGATVTTVAGGALPVGGPVRVDVDVAYDGGGVGKGADVTVCVDGVATGCGRLERTAAYYFAFDETFNLGVDPGAPVTDAYRQGDNRFTGTVHEVTLSLTGEPSLPTTAEEIRTLLAHK